MSSVPHGVFACVCWGGGGGSMDYGHLYPRTRLQNMQSVKISFARPVARRDIFAPSTLASLQSHSLLSPLLFNFPLITRARGLDLGKIRDSFFAVFQDTS